MNNPPSPKGFGEARPAPIKRLWRGKTNKKSLKIKTHQNFSVKNFDG